MQHQSRTLFVLVDQICGISNNSNRQAAYSPAKFDSASVNSISSLTLVGITGSYGAS